MKNKENKKKANKQKKKKKRRSMTVNKADLKAVFYG